MSVRLSSLSVVSPAFNIMSCNCKRKTPSGQASRGSSENYNGGTLKTMRQVESYFLLPDMFIPGHLNVHTQCIIKGKIRIRLICDQYPLVSQHS